MNIDFVYPIFAPLHRIGELRLALPTVIPLNIIASVLCSRPINDLEAKRAGSYPLDYNFLKLKAKYLIGMSVPPVMTAQIATKIYEQWLSKLLT